MIDMDPQASLTFSFISVDEWSRLADMKTVKAWYDVFLQQDRVLELAGLVITPAKANQAIKAMSGKGQVDLICSHLALVNIDLELAIRLAGAGPEQTRDNFLTVHSRLLGGLNVPNMAKYDYVLIDCPPNFNIVTKTAIVASDRILIPAIPDHLSTLGIEHLQRHVDELVGGFNYYVDPPPIPGLRLHRPTTNSIIWPKIDPTIMGVVPTMIKLWAGRPISAQRRFIDRIREITPSVPVFDSFVRRNDTIYSSSPEYGVPIVVQNVSGTYLDVRTELEKLTTEFLDKL